MSLWDLQDEMRDEEIMWMYEDVRAAFEEEHRGTWWMRAVCLVGVSLRVGG